MTEPDMKMGFSPLQGAVTAVVTVLALAGCSGEDPGPGPSSAGGDGDGIAALVACMQDRGWDAVVDDTDGSMTVSDVPEAQQERYRADNLDCQDEIGFGADPADLTEDQLHELYEHEVRTAQCLRDEGIEVPEVTSEQAFHDTYASGNAFSAYASVGDVGQAEWERLNEECPQLPEGW